MWSDDNLSSAQYTAYYEDESKQPLNVGTIEFPSLGTGPYLMTPAPPFGSLSGTDIAGLKNCVKIPYRNLTIQYGPRTWPSPLSANDPTLQFHQYGDGTL